MSVTVTPLTPRSERKSEMSISLRLSAEDFRAGRAAWHRHSVLLIRGTKPPMTIFSPSAAAWANSTHRPIRSAAARARPDIRTSMFVSNVLDEKANRSERSALEKPCGTPI